MSYFRLLRFGFVSATELAIYGNGCSVMEWIDEVEWVAITMSSCLHLGS